MILTYKYRIKDRHAKKALLAHAYVVNQIWNYCCDQQRDVESRYRAGEKPRRWASYFDLCKLTEGVGKELGLYQQSIERVCKVFVQSRDKLKHSPRFRSSYGLKRALGWIPFRAQSHRHDACSITYLRKTYRLFGTKRRPIPDNSNGGCFVEDNLGRWWVCFNVEVESKNCVGRDEIGIDLGLKLFAAISDGRKVEAPRHYRQLESKLVTVQRSRNKQRMRRIHVKIKNTRKDFLHKLSTELAGQNSIIAVGNVSSKRLAQTRFSRSVYDAGWSTFRDMLKYKSAGYVEVDERFTTQTCSQCGELPPERPRGIAGLGIREWDCSVCGSHHDRDVNAARNILKLARSVYASCGGKPESDMTFGVKPDKHDLLSPLGQVSPAEICQ